MLTLGSLFDGIGGFPLAGVRQGFTPAWASEIEPFPIEVTKLRLPQMLHLGDIKKLKGSDLPGVDVVCGGSPCQDLSVAGKRAGLQGERSGLFMEQIRIIKEMRKHDKASGRTADTVRPRYMVWENVPGAFSSADGEDFRAVLEETCRIADSTVSVPKPPGGVWKSAGAVLGYKFSVAWRIYDAQYWGLAQRRRRIYLVADFGGCTAPEILFKQDSLFGDSAKGEESGEGAAVCSETGLGASGGNPFPTGTSDQQSLTPLEEHSHAEFRTEVQFSNADSVAFACNQRDEARELCDVAGAIQAQPGVNQQTFVMGISDIATFHTNQRDEIIDLHGISGALLATHNMQMQTFASEPVLCLNDQGGDHMDVSEDITATLRAGMAGHPPLVLGDDGTPLVTQPHAFSLDGAESNSMKSSNPRSGCRETELARTLDTTNPDPSKNQGGVAIVQESYCIAGNIIDRQEHNGGNGMGFQPDISYTLNTADRHAVFCEQNENTDTDTYQETVGALCRGDEKGIGNQYVSQDKCVVERKKFVRRLTPLECERLMGFPDYWTDIPGASDSARYKALGNSVAIPCVENVLRGIAYFLKKSYEERKS